MNAPQLLTLDQAAERLQVSTSWLYKRAAAYAIPHARLGRSIRFTDEHLRQITEDASVRVRGQRLRSTA